MKKILINFILSLFTLTVSAQVKVLGKIEPNGPTDTYPTHVDSLGKGGLMAVGSWQERNAIPLARRKAGMLVRVKSTTVDSTYTIGGNLANINWTPFASGGTSITNLNQIPARSYNTLQDLPVIPDDVHLLHKTGNETKVGALTIADATNATNVKLINGQVHTISNASNRGIFVTPTDIQFQTELGDFVRLQPSTSLGNASLTIPYLNGNQTIALRSDIPSPVDISGKEDSANKATSIGTGNNTSYPTTLAVKTELDTKLTGTAATNLLNPNNSKFPTAQTMVNALAGYEQNTNKATNLASANNTTYPTTQAVASGLAAKANLTGANNFTGTNNFGPYGPNVTLSANGNGGVITLRNGDVDRPFSIEHLGTEATGFAVRPFGAGSSYTGSFLVGGTATPITDNRYYMFPNNSGTVALTSDISGKADLLGANFIGTVTINPTAPATDDILTVGSSFKVSKYDPYGTITARGRSLHFNSTGGNSASLSVGNATEIGLRVNDLDNDERLVLSPNYWSMRKGTVGMSLQLDGSLYQNVSLTFPTESGKLAVVGDIPKMFTYTASGDDITKEFSVAHGLGYTPTMVIVTANSADAIRLIDKPIITAASIDGNDIVIKSVSINGFAPQIGTNNLTWTIMVK